MYIAESFRKDLIRVEKYLNTHRPDAEGWFFYYEERRAHLLKCVLAAQLKEFDK